MNAADIRAALDRRYLGAEGGGEQWIAIHEARSGAGFQGNDRQCDYLAINTWRARGLQVIGHEIKVSAADWRHELDQPDKAEAFARFCRRWWVVMPSALATRVRDEIPPAWGLLSVSDAGRATELVKAPAREPEEIPPFWWVGWLAQVDRRQKRENSRDVNALVAERLAKERDGWERTAELHRASASEQQQDLNRRIDLFKAETGIDMRHAWPGELARLADLWRAVKSGVKFDIVAKQMRTVADSLEQLSQAAQVEG